MSAGGDSNKVVIAALAGNVLIAASKFFAAFMTGSAATLAEAVHSASDCANQVLLLVGMRLAQRKATEKHPFGRSIEQYFWPFMVSMLLFTVGGAFAFYEGIHKLLHLTTAASAAFGHGSDLWSYGVLGTSFVMEAFSFRVAWGEFKKYKGKKSTIRAMIDARDPTIPIVLLEDAAALVGLLIALVGVGLSGLTGWRGYDGIASLFIGVLLCVVAFFLARETHSLIVGESATLEDRQRIHEIALGVPGVLAVTQLLSMHRGPADVLLALKIAFDPKFTLAEVESTVDALESAIRKELPQMVQIFTEPDSHYDGAVDPRVNEAVLPPAVAERAE